MPGTVNPRIFKSVVKIFAVTCAPNYSRPWQMSSQSHSSSTGFVISGRRVLCNAHGVSYTRSIRLRKHGDSKKYEARIQHIGHECDLAILTVDNPKFWRNLEALEFETKTPALQDTVVVVGYPVGGDDVCVTKGVVSRIGLVTYTHAWETLFSLQIDAAINAGNSGGPTVMGDKVVGVAFMGYTKMQNIGYCIPVRVVLHFLRDIEQNGSYTNFPKLGFKWQKIENPSLKKYLKMLPNNEPESDVDKSADDEHKGDNDESNEEEKDAEGLDGILVCSTIPLTDCADKLKENDVILAVDNVAVGEDGTIEYPFPKDGVSRIDVEYLTSNKFCGDSVDLAVLRDGERMHISVELSSFESLVPAVLYNRAVTYYIFGGLVFVPLSVPYLRAEYGRSWTSKCKAKLKDLYYNGTKEEAGEEIVVLSRVLASDCNVGFHKFTNCLLREVNGVEIKNVAQMIAVIEGGDSEFVHFLFDRRTTMVLERDIAIAGTQMIMQGNKIKFDRSENLRGMKEVKEEVEEQPEEVEQMEVETTSTTTTSQ